MTTLGRYRVGERLGEGGMGEVFRGEVDGAEGFSKTVAIKRIRPSLAQDARVRDALIAEARVARRLEHGNIVQILDLGVDGGVPYLVVEYVEGVSLDELLEPASLPLGDALYVIENVCDALHYAHRLTDRSGRPAGVVHRDVTPRNVLVSREGVVKLADFGLAKALRSPSETLPGTIKGTVGYLSPEQAAGKPLDERTDQFSTGVVLYELIAGRNPLGTTETIAAYRALLEDGLPPLGVDEALDGIVARATAVDPAARFASMADLRSELEAWRVSRGVRLGPEGLRRAVRRRLGEAPTGQTAAVRIDAAELPERPTIAMAALGAGRGWRIAVTGVVLLALGGVGFAIWPAGEAAPRPAVVETQAEPPVETPTELPGQTPGETPAELLTGLEPGTDIAPADTAAESEAEPVAAPRRRARSPGRLKVNTIPWALVSLDGRPLGRTPVNVEVSSGVHELVLENPDTGQRVAKPIRVPGRDTLTITDW